MYLLNLARSALFNSYHVLLTQEQIRNMHSKKFRKLVRYASMRSPYYQKIIKFHHINIEDCVPEDFPVLTKNDMIENFDNIVTDPRITKRAVEDFLSTSKDPTEQFIDTYYVTHSSGT